MHNLHRLTIVPQLLIWSLLIFYVALGTFLIVVGADRIAQTMYDFAQKISHLRFGWTILLAMLGMSHASVISGGATELYFNLVVISFPPCIGHTTTVTLCGFAYGMQGFYLAAGGSMLGSALTFAVLRFLFSKRLRKWSSSNEKWQALESVIVSTHLFIVFPLHLIFY